MTNPLTDNFIEDSALKNDNANFNPLTPYNYGKNVPLTPLSSILSLSVADGDKILSLDETVLSSNLSIKYENSILSLVGKNGEIITSINLPLAQILNQAYYDSETKELVFVFSTSTGETKTTINVGDLVDTYTAGKGLTLSGNQFAIDETVVGTKEDVKIINDNLVQAINTINQNMADGFNTINGGIENEIKPEIAKKVEWTDIHTDDYPERKAIVVKNHDMILGTDTTGGTYNLAMVSKWDVADYGSNKLPFNINSKERPTVQLPGVSGEDAEKIAFLSDIPNTDNFATKDELNAVDSKFGDRFESGNTVSASITNIEQNLEGEVSLRKQADEQIALNLQGVSDRVSAIEAQTSGSSEFDAIKSDVETLKTDNTAIKSDIDTLKGDNATIKSDIEALKAEDAVIKPDVEALKAEDATIKSDIEALKAEDAVIKPDIEALKAEDVTIKSDINSLKESVAKKVDWLDIHTEEYPERKAIVLKNHDMLLGTDTTGSTYNLAMISKWDIADFGTNKLDFNINSKERPTVQLPGVSGEDAEKIAFLSDIPNTENFATKDEVNNKVSAEDVKAKLILSSTTDSLHYQLTYDGTSLGEIAIPEDQFLESVEYISAATEADRVIEPSIVIVGDPYLKFVFRITGSKKVYTYIPIKTMVSDLATKNEVQKLGIVDLGNVSSSGEAEKKALEQSLTANNIMFKYTVNNTNNGIIFNSVLNDGSAVQMILLNGEFLKRTISPSKEASAWMKDNKVILGGKYINSMTLFKLTTSASSEDVQNSLKYDGLNSNVITKADLDSCLIYGYLLQDAIMREMVQVSWNGNSYVLTEIAHFNPKTDIKCGTIAINVTDAGEYSVTKDGTIDTILTDKNISKNSVISNVMNELNSFAVLYDRISMLESKLDSLTLEGAESVSEFDGTQSLNDTGKSYVITTGSITNSNTIAGKNVSISDSTLTNNARLTVNAKSVDFNKLSVSGDFPKANGNSVIKVNDSDYITFKDLTFDSSNVYNGIEIGLSTSASTLPKNIIFENCKFTGTFANNAILVFGTQDNAIITLSNCSFDKVSNVLRLSNRTNAKNVTVNVVNCSVNQWDTNEYAGFLLCQDYTSSASDVDTNNLFGDGKITVNFVNLMHKGSKVMPTDVASVCGVGNDSQVVYVYTDANNAITSYSSDKYPVIKFS